MRIALVTCLLGPYDKLKPIHHFNGFDAICFSDQYIEDPVGWTVRPINQAYHTVDERVRICRKIKIKIHEYLPDYDIWIWTDSSLKWKVSPIDTLSYLSNGHIATFKYHKRDCIYEEGLACIQRGKDNEKTIDNHLQKYVRDNYPKNYGLVETTVVIRKNNHAAINFNNHWWAELENGSRRDQLSFNYVCWKLNTDYSVLPGYRLNNSFAEWEQHDEIIYTPKHN